MKTRLFCSLLIFVVLIISNFALAQEKENTVVDSVEYPGAQSIILSSIIVPGTGQLLQERLWESAFFYGMAAHFYYQSYYYFKRYNKTHNSKYLNIAQSRFSIAIFNHILNIADAYSSSRNKKLGWDGTLFSDKPVKSPWGATLRSAMFPGWGQWYNESYIKSAFYFSATVFVGYQIYWNAKQYKDTGKKKYEDDRSRYSWYMGLTYLLMLADAHVDANLFEFKKAVELAVLPYNDGLKINLTYTF